MIESRHPVTDEQNREIQDSGPNPLRTSQRGLSVDGGAEKMPDAVGKRESCCSAD